MTSKKVAGRSKPAGVEGGEVRIKYRVGTRMTSWRSFFGGSVPFQKTLGCRPFFLKDDLVPAPALRVSRSRTSDGAVGELTF